MLKPPSVYSQILAQRLRRAQERGAVLIESAIVFLPLCMILFGMIEYGLIFKNSLTLSSATRAAVRTASAEPRAPSFYTDTVASVTASSTAAKFKNGDTLFIYRADADGMPEGSAGNKNYCGTACTKYVWNGSKFILSGSIGWAPTSQDACVGNADSVGVALNLSHDAISGFFKNMQLQERSAMRLEPLDTDCES